MIWSYDEEASTALYESTFDELIDYAFHTKEMDGAERESREERGGFFSDSFEESLRLADQGWMEGINKMDEAASNNYEISGNYIASEDGYGPAGAFPIIPLYTAGCVENMLTAKSENKPFARILFYCGYHGGTDSDEIMKFGAKILNLVDEIDAAGISTEVDAGFCAVDSDSTISAIVNIKQAGQPLDLGRLSFSACHPSFFRRLGFSVIETCPYKKLAAEFTHRGYGSRKQFSKNITDQYDVYIKEMDDGQSDFGSMMKKMLKAIKI